MFASRNKARHTLGVYHAATGLRGALVRHDSTGAAILQLFGDILQTTGGTSIMDEPALATIGDDLASSYGGDGAANSGFGGDGAGAPTDVFLSSEFGQIQVPLSTDAPPVGAALLVDELKRMLASCRELGISDIDVAWSLPTSHISWTETQDKDSSAAARPGRIKKADDRDAIPQEGERSVVLKMTPHRDNSPRLLTATPRSDEPSAATIKAIRNTQDSFLRNCVTDSEISSLFALALAPKGTDDYAAGEPTLVVRIGEDDVLVLVVEERCLKQVDVLRSLSLHDGADMICSRILLLQDEHGLDGLARIYVTGADDDRLLDSFRTYFQQANVLSLGSEVGRLSTSGAHVDPQALPAVGAALRGVLDLTVEDNMLPLPLRRPRRTIPYSWEVWTLLIILSLTALFFVGRFLAQESVITSRYDRIDALTHDVRTAALLQHRIDSLQVAYSVNMKGLDVLDSLLLGSDKWSRTFDHIARQISEIEGIWIEKWQPAGPIVAITGQATSRDRIVDLAQRLNGTIEEIIYPDEEAVYYFFRMKAPIINGLPQAAQYLRDRAANTPPDTRRQTTLTGPAHDAGSPPSRPPSDS